MKAEIPLSDEIERIITRLESDVGPALEIYRTTGTGNWASVRLMAPIIESISSGNVISRKELLKSLGVVTPEIFWEIYRHGLLHNDMEPQSLAFEGIELVVGWGFDWGQIEATKVTRNHLVINPGVLYDNLLTWLKEKNKSMKDDEYIRSSILKEIPAKKQPRFQDDIQLFKNI